MNDKEKHYTLKNVRTELKKVKAAQESKRVKMQELKAAIKADGKRIRELEGIYESLCHESLQHQIATAWFKEQRLSPEQIGKILQLSAKIHDQVDTMDVDTVAQLVQEFGDAPAKNDDSGKT